MHRRILFIKKKIANECDSVLEYMQLDSSTILSIFRNINFGNRMNHHVQSLPISIVLGHALQIWNIVSISSQPLLQVEEASMYISNPSRN